VATGSKVTLNGKEIYPVSCEDTLDYWVYMSSTVSSKHENFGDTPLAKELEKRTGIKVNYIHPQSGQGAEQFQIMLAGDDLPDIVYHQWNNYPGGPQMAINDGYIYNLNDIIDEYAPALKKVLRENETYNKHAKNDDGNYYAFPFLLEEGILQMFYGPIIREDWLKKVNMKSPETIGEWETVLTAFKEKLGAAAPYSGDTTATLTTFASGFDVYVDWYLDDGKVIYGPMQPGYKDLLMKLNSWYNKGLIDVDFASVKSSVTNKQLLNGQTGAIIGYAGGGIGDLMDANEDIEGFSLIGAKYPSPEKGRPAEYGSLASPVNMGCSTAISRNCKNVELAARYLDYGFTEEGHNLYNFGIEGLSYNWENGYPKYTDLILNNPDGWNMTEAMGAYMQSAYNGTFVQDTRYIEQYYKRPQQKEAQLTWNGINMAEHLLPQLYIDSANSDIDSDIMAGVKTYVDEMTVKFINGKESFEKYDEYLAQLEQFGIEKSIALRQEAYERYLNR
jgi:putative aldouronate transport system substrate-binding protein